MENAGLVAVWYTLVCCGLKVQTYDVFRSVIY